MNVLSVDLASRRYTDFGLALLRSGENRPTFPVLEDMGLEGEPEAKTLASALDAYCREEQVEVLLLDGPQAWRWPGSPIEHMRLCERVLNTSGKTGVPGQAKPRTYLGYIQFSIDVFHHLRVGHGWRLLTQDWADHAGRRWLVESFPSAAWRLLGLNRLPGQPRDRPRLAPWARDLEMVSGMKLREDLSHDELQAAVVLPAGRAIAERRPEGVILAGVDPIIHEGTVYEGWIACPRAGPP